MKKFFATILMAVIILAMCGCEEDFLLATPSTSPTGGSTISATTPAETEPSASILAQTQPAETTTPGIVPTEPVATEPTPSIPGTEPTKPEQTVPETTVHTHTYTATVTDPTCTENGYTTHTCACGDSYQDSEIKATGHSYNAQVTAPTCTAKGYTTHTCACGDSYNDSETSATGHSYTGKVTKEAYCTATGVKTYTCRCGSSYSEEIAMLPHSYTSVVTPPTYTAQGYTTHTCSCGDQYIDTYTDVLTPKYPVLEHNFYEIYTQVCTDGSAWVGFAVPGNMDTMDTSSRVWNLMEDCVDIFCEWTGYSREYVMENRGDKFLVYMVSVAGYMETPDGICEVIFRYIRGVNMPVDTPPPVD